MEQSFKSFLDGLLMQTADIVKRLVVALAIFFIGHLLIKWLMKLLKKSKFAEKSDPTVVRVLNNFIRVGLYIVLVVTIVGIMGVPMASVVAAIASAGVAIGLALQGALSNLAGGIMILLFRPFRLDDYIEAGDYSGTVIDVGIFYTVLKTPDNKVVTIPNGTIMSESVVNYSVMDTRRVEIVVSVAYGSDIEQVKTILLGVADEHELVLKDPAPFARLAEHGDSSLDFKLRVWVKRDDYWTVHFDLMETVANRLEEAGIEIPFNQLDVHITK
jgi:small conductance mechanosensitive channel